MRLLWGSVGGIEGRAGHVRNHFVGTCGSVPDALLPLELQNTYRARYREMRPGWQTSGSQLEAMVRGYATPESSVLDLGCGRGGGVERVWRGVELAAGRQAESRALSGRRARGAPSRPRALD